MHLLKYFLYLNGIFEKNNNILKYFGNNFFHDGWIKSISFNDNNSITITFAREPDYEDLNSKLKTNNLKGITFSEYRKNPKYYIFTFKEAANFVLTSKTSKNCFIMDTEILYNTRQNQYSLEISFSDKSLLMVQFKNIRVVIDASNIHRHSKGLFNHLGYCPECSSRLLHKHMLDKNIKELTNTV
jgi:hypothetical protein